MSSPTRVLVTGAAGRLGSTVADRFHAEGFELLATDVADAGDTPYRFERADLLDHAAASVLLDGIDAVLHIGNHPGIGATPPQVVFNENVAMNENVFQGAAERGVATIVFASTLQLIGSHADERTVVTPTRPPHYPLGGETVPDPANVYALSKTVSEVMLRYYAERCGVAGVALRFPMLHHHDDRVMVASGEERPVDVLEGFTGLSYHDAAAAFLAVVRAELTGYHVFMPGTTHRHRDLAMPDLIRAFYGDIAPDTADLIDTRPIRDATGWSPSDDYVRPGPPTDPTKDLHR